jgi:hypothetical protein
MRMKSLLLVPLFYLAAGAAHATQTATFSAELPFRDCRGLICIDIAVDDAQPRTLVLDTGNTHSALMADTARALGWKTEPYEQNGKTIADIYRGGAHEVHFGKTSVKADFIVFERALMGDNPLPGDGTLAYTFFKDRILQIDYPHHTLRISDVQGTSPSGASPGAGSLQLITFGKKGPPIVVGGAFTLNGKSVHAQIDTCYTGTLLVYDAAIDDLGLRSLLGKGKPEFFPDTDGGVTLLGAPVQSLGFADATLMKAPAKIYFSGQGKNPVHQPDGLFEATVGNALLSHSVVTMDFHSMTLDVRPDRGA